MQNKALWKNSSFFHSKANLFVIKVLLVYIVWKVFHYFAIKPDGIIYPYWLNFITALGTFYAGITSSLLNIIGQNTFAKGIIVTFSQSRNYVLVEDHCLAIPAMVIFTGSILLFPGSWKNKAWFIPLGLIGIFIINTLRLIFVCLAFEYMSKQFYEINHSFVYLVVTYGLIFSMIMWWMKRFDGTEEKKKA